MYKCTKAPGKNSNVLIQNTETHAQVIIGRISIDILKILTLADDNTTLQSEWNMDISIEQAQALSRIALRADERKLMEQEQKQKKTQNKTIDAMDVMLGLTSYVK